MQDCLSASAQNTPAVPNKRLNYAFGMVLGVDDFRQEQANIQWKFQLDARLPHGYGTLCGLGITQRALPDGSDVEIRIAPGYAISPQGHWLWVSQDLCALLNAWLLKHNAEHIVSPVAGPRSVYVRLCYTECLTDLVPIAANACASADDSSAPSRITETASADFTWTPPAQIAEERVRDFGKLLSEVEIVPGVLSPDDSAPFLQRVRELGTDETPVVSPDVLSPPQGKFRLSESTACDTFDQALLIWATEVRPTLNGAGRGCLPQSDDEDCLLLARLDFNVNAQGLLAGPVTIVQDDRPILADTRLLQEWLTCGRQAETLTASAVTSPPATLRHSELLGLDADDHKQYLLVNPADRSLVANLDAAGNQIKNLAPGAGTGDAVPFQQAIKVTDPAGGDLGGQYPNPLVAGLQGRPLLDLPAPAPDPTAGQVLTFTGTGWQAQAAGGLTLPEIAVGLPTLPFATITPDPRGGSRSFRVWFHLNAGGGPDGENLEELDKPAGGEVQLFAELDQAAGNPLTFLQEMSSPQQPLQVSVLRRNVWRVTVGNTQIATVGPLLRFVFHLNRMRLLPGNPNSRFAGITLAQYVGQRPMLWEGHSSGGTVTVFVDNTSVG